jgi:hypothetical protein
MKIKINENGEKTRVLSETAEIGAKVGTMRIRFWGFVN